MPFSGTAIAVPGSFEAENFDLGGEGVAYHDNTPGNQGGQYRLSENVDIIVSSDPLGGGYVVNNFETGEWMNYTVNVQATALYTIELRASSMFSNSAFHVEIDGVNVTGTVVVPTTGSWSAFQWIGKKGVSLAAGKHMLKIVADQQYFNLNSARVTATPPSTPLAGTPISIPGTFEAENFDLGGEGVAYHDNTPGNQGGQYRLSEDVDIIVSSDPLGGGYVVNNFETGEWMNYTVNVQATALYDIEIRASTTFSNSAFHMEMDRKDVTGTIIVPTTGSWSAFQWAGKKGVSLAAGNHVLRIVTDQQYFNLNSVRLTKVADTLPPSIPANLAATVVSSSRIDLSWSASVDNVGVSGYYVYRNGLQVANVSGTRYSDTGLLAATTYAYSIAAYDAAGNVSAQSSAVSATTRPLQAPYSGTPVSIPGSFEAENFDLGGEGVAYHDNTPGNQGGQYRLSEDVDIIVSSDPLGGGYVVNNFETGEWLKYSINVATSANYDIEIRASSMFSNSAFHVEIDGVNVTGTVVVPNTGSWSGFQWIGKKGVPLTAGNHVLKIVSDQQYFNLNAIRVPATPTPGPAKLLFSSGFEGSTALNAPSGFYGTGAWQGLAGLDSVTGFAWPPNIWGGGATQFQLLVDAPVDAVTVDNYMVNQIQTVTGHNGNPTQALFSEIKQSGCCGTNPQGGGPTQDPFMLQPVSETSDLYISYWLKHQPNFADLMQVGQAGTGWNWRVVFEWKTAGDYRVNALIKRDPNFNGGNLYWSIQGDNNANGGLPYQIFWQSNNTQVPVPAGQWLKFEVFWHRSSGNDGRVWMAVNGQVLVDHYGPNKGINNASINRIMMPNLYSSTAYPISQWVDDMQIWDGFPSDAAPH